MPSGKGSKHKMKKGNCPSFKNNKLSEVKPKGGKPKLTESGKRLRKVL